MPCHLFIVEAILSYVDSTPEPGVAIPGSACGYVT